MLSILFSSPPLKPRTTVLFARFLLDAVLPELRILLLTVPTTANSAAAVRGGSIAVDAVAERLHDADHADHADFHASGEPQEGSDYRGRKDHRGKVATFPTTPILNVV